MCSLSVQRLRTLQDKKEAQAKVARRDIATLLERGKVETARIKVESSMSESYFISYPFPSLTVLCS
jgi:vacuolar protein sorting-associated protein IST1